jgi:molybdate-binding protein/transcriptional regulator with XRE-family HTH domain
MSYLDTTMSIPTPLASFRQQRGWSQAALAERSGVSRTEISAIETGRLAPSVAVALRLAAVFNETVETLFRTPSRSATIDWAWEQQAGDRRCWWGSVDGRLLAYPIEHTAAGSIPHDDDTSPQEARPDRTLIMAGCDPLAGLLVHEMGARHGIRVVPLLRSSAEALDLLRRGLVHVAGLHFTDAGGRSTNHLRVKSILGSGYRLLHQVQWESGIAVVATRKERTADALLRANVRWVNREEGSAARQAFDLLLASRRKPSGYSHVVRDHRAVAATISSGWADAGICVKPAAADAQLRFIPLLQEAYELCVSDALLDDPRVSALVMTLQTTWYRRLLAGVPGCVSRDTGSVRLVA